MKRVARAARNAHPTQSGPLGASYNELSAGSLVAA